MKEANKFEMLQIAFKTLGFRAAELRVIFQVLLAVSLSRHLQFCAAEGDEVGDGITPGDPSILEASSGNLPC